VGEENRQVLSQVADQEVRLKLRQECKSAFCEANGGSW